MAHLNASGTDTNVLMSYTHQLSNDMYRKRERTERLNMSKSSIVDGLQRVLSIFASFFITSYFVLGLIALIPSVVISTLWAYFVEKNRSHYFASRFFAWKGDVKSPANVSNSSGSWTAIAVLASRAVFSNGLGGPDDLSLQLLYETYPLGSNTNIWGLQSFFNGFWYLVRLNLKVTKRIYTDQLNSKLFPEFQAGITTYLQARTCFMDDVVEEFVRRHGDKDKSSISSKPTANVVILGAGYDSRSYRINLNLNERGVNTFEVDAPGTHRDKLRLLKQCQINFHQTKHVPCDFVSQDWMEQLVNVGKIDTSLPTLFIWEGVTQFLPREVVVETLQKVTKTCAPGSCIAFDYFGKWSLQPTIRGFTAGGGEEFLFALDTEEAKTLIEENELKVWDHLSNPKILAARYLPCHPNGEPIGHLGNGFGGFILAGKEVKQEK